MAPVARIFCTLLLLAGVDSKSVNNWWFLGPFSVGKTEIDGDPVRKFFEDGMILPGNNSQLIERGVFSEFVDGGQMRWTRLRSRNGRNRITLEDTK